MNGTRRSGRRSKGYFGVVAQRPKAPTNIGTLWRSAFLYDAAFIGTIGARYQHQPHRRPNTNREANHIRIGLRHTIPERTVRQNLNETLERQFTAVRLDVAADRDVDHGGLRLECDGRRPADRVRGRGNRRVY